MINRVVLVGRLTRDPELRVTPNGVSLARFSLAVNRTFRNQQGEREADFINCIVWRKQAENVANYLSKGSLVGVEGRIETGSYEKDGRRVYTTDIVCDSVQFLEPRSANQSRGGDSSYQQGNFQQQGNYQQQGSPFDGNQGGQYQSQQQSDNFGSSNEKDPFASSQVVNVSDDDLPF